MSHRLTLGSTRLQHSAYRRARLLANGHVRLQPHLFENAEECFGLFCVALGPVAGEIPFAELDIWRRAEKAPRDYTRGVNKMFNVVVGLGDRFGTEGGEIGRASCRERG